MQLIPSVIFGLVFLFAFIKIYTGHPKLSKLRRKNITDKPVEEGSVDTGHPKLSKLRRKNITDKPVEEGSVDEYKKEYFKVSSDVSYVKSQWDNYIINSLNLTLRHLKNGRKETRVKMIQVISFGLL